MGFSVNTNNNAMAALRTLNFTNRDLSTVQTRINSGLKVNNARDNASTFAIAQGIRGDIAGMKAVQESLSFGMKIVGNAETDANQIYKKLEDMKAKIVQASGDGVDKQKIQDNIALLKGDIDAIASASGVNGINLLSASPDNFSVVTSLNRTDATTVSLATTAVSGVASTSADLGVAGIDVTAAANNGVKFSSDITAGTSYTDEDYFTLTVGGKNHFFIINEAGGDVTTDLPVGAGDEVHVIEMGSATEALNVTNNNLIAAMRDAGFNVDVADDGSFTTTHADGNTTATATLGTAVMTTAVANGAANLLAAVETAMQTVNATSATFGAIANRLEGQGDFIKSLTDSLSEGVGILVDADLAEESARLQALQTKQQLGLQALSIANQGPGAVLSLFR